MASSSLGSAACFWPSPCAGEGAGAEGRVTSIGPLSCTSTTGAGPVGEGTGGGRTAALLASTDGGGGGGGGEAPCFVAVAVAVAAAGAAGLAAVELVASTGAGCRRVASGSTWEPSPCRLLAAAVKAAASRQLGGSHAPTRTSVSSLRALSLSVAGEGSSTHCDVTHRTKRPRVGWASPLP